MKKNPKTMPLEIAANAVVVDFEGNPKLAPSLIGWMVDERITQVVLEPGLRRVTSRFQFGIQTLEQALLRLRSVTGDRALVGYSPHEVLMVDTWCQDVELREWFRSTYVNAKPIIDRWISQQIAAGIIKPLKRRSLAESMRLVGMNYPAKCGVNTVAKNLTDIRKSIQQHADIRGLPADTRIKWVRIRRHNTIDLQATKALLIEAAKTPPAPPKPPAPRGAINRFATSINVDPEALKRILGTNWTLSPGWALGTGMAFGPCITQKTGTPRIEISVVAWGTHRPKPDMHLTLRLAPSSGDWVEPERGPDGGPKLIEVKIKDDWETELRLAFTDICEYPVSAYERVVDPLEVVDYWNSTLARGDRPTVRDLAASLDVRMNWASEACTKAWDAELINAPRPRFV